VVGPAEAPDDGYISGGGVSHQLGNGEWTDALGSLFDHSEVLIFQFLKPADSRSDDRSAAFKVFLGEIDPAVQNGFDRRRHR